MHVRAWHVLVRTTALVFGNFIINGTTSGPSSVFLARTFARADLRVALKRHRTSRTSTLFAPNFHSSCVSCARSTLFCFVLALFWYILLSRWALHRSLHVPCTLQTTLRPGLRPFCESFLLIFTKITCNYPTRSVFICRRSRRAAHLLPLCSCCGPSTCTCRCTQQPSAPAKAGSSYPARYQHAFALHLPAPGPLALSYLTRPEARRIRPEGPVRRSRRSSRERSEL